MYIIAIACLLNIILDYVFIGLFHMGPIGAALGTTVSQSVSVIIALISMKYRTSDIHIKKEDLHLQSQVFKHILKVGFPVAIQDGCVQIAFMIITIIANSRGLNDAAAVGIVEKDDHCHLLLFLLQCLQLYQLYLHKISVPKTTDVLVQF